MIAVGCDHAGFKMKAVIEKFLDERGDEYRDFGTFTEESCDYPDIAKIVCTSVLSGECERGILICGTGIGMSIAANRLHGIRASLCGDCFSARETRQHNDSNVLILGGRVLGDGLACQITQEWLDTPFSGGERHCRRNTKVDEL